MSDLIYELAQENPSCKSLYSSKTSVNSKKSLILSSCRICLSSILDPASLSCGHQFCETCLENYWDAKDRPDFIVCPLCRTNAFNVDFIKKDASAKGTADFRKTFNTLAEISESAEETNNSPSSCFKLSILVPAMYYLWKWLGLPIIDLLTFLNVNFGRIL